MESSTTCPLEKGIPQIFKNLALLARAPKGCLNIFHLYITMSTEHNFKVDEESMKYKNVIRKAKRDVVNGSTKEYMIFDVVSKSTKVKVSFLFDWAYDEDGFSYKQLQDFSGHKRYTEEEQTWLEKYCKQHYPDGHHMSY